MIENCIKEQCKGIDSKILSLIKSDVITIKELSNDYKHVLGYFNGKKIYINIKYFVKKNMLGSDLNCPFLCSVMKHELIHMICFQKPLIVYSKFNNILDGFYKELWSQLVESEYAPHIARANYNVAVLTDKTDIENDKLAKYNWNIYSSFYEFLVHNKGLFLSEELFKKVIEVIKKLAKQQYMYDRTIQKVMAKSYIKVYGDYDHRSAFGQEFMFASEVFSIAAGIHTTKAQEVVNKIIELA